MWKEETAKGVKSTCSNKMSDSSQSNHSTCEAECSISFISFARRLKIRIRTRTEISLQKRRWKEKQLRWSYKYL
jgi:hypothetical protein